MMGFLFLRQLVKTDFGVHPASYPMRTGALSPGVKRPGRKDNHSPPSSAEVKNAWSYVTTPPIHLHGLILS
jgi:hypothetical protein